MEHLEVKNLCKDFGTTRAVDGVPFSLEKGKCLVLLGPSGCGKTTTLRLLAGFLYPDQGRIVMDGHEIASSGHALPPERRNMSMVFQSYAVWPHKTVFDNIAYGLQLRHLPKSEIQRKVNHILETVRLQGLSKRYPGELSGGQQQRVAFARALVVEPAILLFDEPLSNLDAVLREEMRFELKELQNQLGITSVYVTHDQREAMVLADTLILMDNGRVAQIGRPDEVYLHPASRFVASFLGTTNFFTGKVSERTNANELLVTLEHGEILHALGPSDTILSAGAPVVLSIRPVDFHIARGKSITPNLTAATSAQPNILHGRITLKVFLGEAFEYSVRWQTQDIQVKLPLKHDYSIGEEVDLVFEYDKTVCLPQ